MNNQQELSREKNMGKDIRKSFIKKSILALNLCGLFFATTASAAVAPKEWNAIYNSPENGNDYVRGSSTDTFGNVFVTGRTINANGGYDIVTVKYDSAGNQMWAARYNGTGNGIDTSWDVKSDSNGNAYVTGLSWNGSNSDIVTIKYDSVGNQKWVALYDQADKPNNSATKLIIDNVDNIYVAGTSSSDSTDSDYTIIKYNPAGNQLWVNSYNGPANGRDYAIDITVDSENNVFITGASEAIGSINNSNTDIATIKYNSTGAQQWVTRYNGPGNTRDAPTRIIKARREGILLVGNSSNGNDRHFVAMRYEDYGNVVLTEWIKTYGEADNQNYYATDAAIDLHENLYVLVSATTENSNNDYLTFKYGGTGDLVWTTRFNGTANSRDNPDAIAVDSVRNVYVTGSTRNTDNTYELVTVKYNATGIEQWRSPYNRNGSNFNRGRSISVNSEDEVFVAGVSRTTASSQDYVTIKFSAANRPPIAHAGYGKIVECTGNTTSVTLDGSYSSDPDGDTLTYNWTGPFGTATGVSPTIEFNLGTTRPNLKVNDGTSDSYNSTTYVIVRDTTAPYVYAGADVTIEATNAFGGASYTANPTVTDTCGATSFSIIPTSTTFPSGTSKITVEASDGTNFATDYLYVTVDDTTAPSITAPADITVGATGTNTTVSIGTATATDIVGVTSITSNAPATFTVGSTTVTWTAKDAKGNSATATQIITVTDTIAPVITAPANVTAEATGVNTSLNIGTATATDNVGITSITSNAPATFPVGSTTVIWTAKDAKGNSATATQIITVTDNTAPVIIAPADVNVEATSSDTTVVIGTATATDAVGVASITSNAPTTFPVGSTTVTWTATDAKGNSATATQTVIVKDTIAPVITAPAGMTVEATGLGTIITIGTATATDAVDVYSITDDSPAEYPVGQTIVTWTATDKAGNSSSATQTIIVVDTTAPVVTAPAAINMEATGPQSIVALGNADATDAVGVDSLTNNAPATFPVGETIVTWTATDAAGNSSTATQTVIIVDTTAPVVTAPAAITVEANAVNSTVVIGNATATDAVGVVNLSSDAPTTFALGTTTVTWSATDAAGNIGTATQLVIVIDTTPPALTIPANVTVDATAIQSTVVIGNPSASDIFGATVTSDAPATFATGTTNVTYTAIDGNGLITTATQVVTVLNVAPELPALADVTMNEADSLIQTVNFEDVNGSNWTVTVDYGDGSAVETTSVSTKSFDLNHTYVDNGNFLVSITVEDDHHATYGSGVSTTSIDVTVNNVAPTIDNFSVTEASSTTSTASIADDSVVIPVGSTVNAALNFSDLGILDTHSLSINWGDSASVNIPNVVSGDIQNHIYSAAGVYTVAITLTDKDSGVASTSYEYVVVYDPSAGFVTGGGSINSPEGAYMADVTLKGKATFGFVSKYKKGQTTPDGNTQFNFKTGGLSFNSTNYEWLVIAGARGTFKGTGTINGTGNYGFMLTAVDGNVPGGGDVDKFRIKIWDKDNADAVVYDNQMYAADDDAITTAIAKGSIVIHSK